MKENLNADGMIRTYTGRYINPLDPDPEMICIDDIAWALSMQPRFGGHAHVFYSIAEHCLAVAKSVPDEFKISALMHDASEAYLLDIPSPVKRNIKGYAAAEDSMMLAIANCFEFRWPCNEVVKAEDRYQLELEWRMYVIQTQAKAPTMDQATAYLNFKNYFKAYNHPAYKK